MGEVYQGRDTRLGREVAVKVLPEGFAAEPGRLYRFEQEARAAAALNHPNICSVYDLGSAGGIAYVVAELLEGETLRAALAGGPVPARKAAEWGAQVARGLAAAHERGIVHRDLKPENLFLTRDGQVKILDFGLAKLGDESPAASQLTHSPTLPPGTSPGTVLGTVGYMAPEQVRGQAADPRSDVFALGAVLYESVTGRRAFARESAADTMAAILREEPPEPASGELPAALERVIRHCLEKRPQDRFQSARDLAFDLESVAAGASSTSAVGTPAARARRRWAPAPRWAVAAGLAVAASALGWAWRNSTREFRPESVVRFAVEPPPGATLTTGGGQTVALTPDGTQLVFSAFEPRESRSRLYLRRLDRLEATPLAGAEGAAQPFVSPDGDWIGFFAQGRIARVSVRGGPAVTVAEIGGDPAGFSFAPDGSIVLAPRWGSGLLRIPASGGAPQPLTELRHDKDEGGHVWPAVLPGGDAVLFTVWTKAPWDQARIEAASLSTGERKVILEGGRFGRYSATGHLLFVRSHTLLAAPFDARRLVLTGEPVPVAEKILTSDSSGSAEFAVAADGTVAYVHGAEVGEIEVVWMDRSGAATPALEDRDAFQSARLSPDGRRVAVTVEGATFHIRVYDLAGGTRSRLTPEADSGRAVWSPDGRWLLYWANEGGPYGLFRKPADGSAPAERLATPGGVPIPGAVTGDGRTLLFTREDVEGEGLWTLPLEGERIPRALLDTPASELAPALSPDGRFLAYASSETGRSEIYVVGHPQPGAPWQVSAEGGAEPRWSPAGDELFFRRGDALVSVAVATDPEFRAGRPAVLFEDERLRRDPQGYADYDVAPDGQRFLILRHAYDESEISARRIHVVLNGLHDRK